MLESRELRVQGSADRRFVGLIVWQGLLLSGVSLSAFLVGMQWYGAEGLGLRHASTHLPVD